MKAQRELVILPLHSSLLLPIHTQGVFKTVQPSFTSPISHTSTLYNQTQIPPFSTTPHIFEYRGLHDLFTTIYDYLLEFVNTNLSKK